MADKKPTNDKPPNTTPTDLPVVKPTNTKVIVALKVDKSEKSTENKTSNPTDKGSGN
jgi:hypothetical protein